MKRSLRSILSVGVLALALVTVDVGLLATAGADEPDHKKVQRTVTGSYTAYPAPVTGCNAPLGPWACMIVPTRPTERFVTVKVTDTHGLPVYFTVFRGGQMTGFCGETKTPFAFGGGTLEIEVGVSRWVVQTDCPVSSVKTTGTIKVTLSNMR